MSLTLNTFLQLIYSAQSNIFWPFYFDWMHKFILNFEEVAQDILPKGKLHFSV
jgi:hypothetical protein